MIKKLWAYKIFRFITIGVINTLTDISILNLLVFAFGAKVIYANLVSASISITLSYFWNHFIVFRHQNKATLKLFIKFFVITGLGILVIQTLVIYGVEHLVNINQIMNTTHLSHSLSKVLWVNGAKLFAVAISMVWNFFLYTFAIFKVDKEEEGIQPY
jgi:putative flippase GtrA